MRSGSVWKNIDYLVIAIVLLISGLSLFVIGSATKPLLPASAQLYYVHRQMIWIGLGLVTMTIVAWYPYERFRQLSPYLYWIAVALLAFVLIKGHSALGAQRWIQIGPFQLQPSEFAKVAVVVAFATHLDKKPQLKRWRDLVSPGLLLLLPMLLILKQPDLGTALVFVAIAAGMLLMAGASWWKLLIIFPGGLLAVILWIYIHYRFHVWIPMHQYQLDRLIIFLNPNKDPLGAGFNVIQSRIAVGSGGLLGTGIFTAHSNQLSFLPESYTDFIFAVIAEEVGFVGSMALLAVYLLLLARGLFIAVHAKDRYGMLLASGVVSMFAFHVIESAGMVSGIMPVAGVPLPFMSYGGSALLADSVGVGILLNVYLRRRPLSYANTANASTRVVMGKSS
ncbi:rod shape-determining protein RodA [Sulfobacillus sp. hq2]|uniref:Peptidoglycan glycosyltransferase RodA n=1 Tax=Sulfobacillus thermotolerans TaxID=338644 RepID=A0ABM6RPA3_9FIRM|nr:rod shape-determining protein RodA [Sulfobacillus sp. hq2]AUW93164.1 rod shape-determining protein RodA [Sulfobacillus thermotolerans]MCY0908405.1 rod shape-determining protein RodA [Sulfobacillus thermotolerans]POB11804.1 rod shape-determining protein RodA [Sulfobacillus sp. hq2]